MSNNHERKTAVITGGRQGIGRALVEAFFHDGARVLTCGRGERPEGLPDNVLWHKTDVSKKTDVDALKELAVSVFGKVDVLINNAGIQLEKTLLETTDKDWDTLMGVNARGVFMMCRAFIPVMTEGGSIINIGSISGKVADPGLALYNASKAFVHSLTRSIAIDHGPNIRCNAICPGWIMTDMADAAFKLASNPESAKQDALARHAVKRFGDPKDVASLAVWLAGDDASFATGQCYTLDGGLTAASPINTKVNI